MSEMQAVSDMALEKIILWQDFTKPHGYRDSLTLIRYPDEKYAYEFSVGGTVRVVPYNKFWKELT